MRQRGAIASTSVGVALVVVLLACETGSAQVRYVDDQGRVHWVQSPDQVPPQYRDQGQPKLPEAGASERDPGVRAKQRFEEELMRRRLQEEEESMRRRREAEFQQVARLCAARAGVQITLKPGAKVDYLGTTQARFYFGQCMAENGHAIEGVR